MQRHWLEPIAVGVLPGVKWERSPKEDDLDAEEARRVAAHFTRYAAQCDAASALKRIQFKLGNGPDAWGEQ